MRQTDRKSEPTGSRRAAYCTVAQAAAALDVSRATVWRWIDTGRLPAYRVGPRRLRIKTDDLDSMIKPTVAMPPPPGAEGPTTIQRRAEVKGRIRFVDPERGDDIWADYDPRRVRRVLRQTAGALRGVDIEALKGDLRAARRQDSRGRPA